MELSKGALRGLPAPNLPFCERVWECGGRAVPPGAMCRNQSPQAGGR